MKLISIAALALVCGVSAHRHHHHVKKMALMQKESDELCDGDSADDKEIDDENDPDNHFVQDHGFAAGYYRYAQLPNRPMDNQHLLYAFSKYSDSIANGDSADDKDLHEEEDTNDAVVDINGSGKARYGHAVPVDFFAGNKIFPDHFGTIPREDVQLDEQNLVQQKFSFDRYSDSIANGDSADDKDLHEEEDTNDAVVDINGSGAARYGHAVPVDFFAGNHIFPDHFGTVPRED